MKISDDFSKIKWIRWRWQMETAEENDNKPNNRQTKITPGHKSPQQSQPNAVDDFGDLPRVMHPHIGMNPFLNGSTYLNDIIVQNSMLRGESVRESSLNIMK